MSKIYSIAPFNLTLAALTIWGGLLNPSPVLALEESSDYSKQYTDQVIPYFENQGVAGSFTGVSGISINYRVFLNSNEKGALVILPGRSEPYYNYAEIVYDLRDLGFSVYLLDHRGQGYSGRLLPDPEKGYVKHFNDYVTDFSYFMDHVVNTSSHAKRFILTHSMGGAIAALYLESHPGSFDGAIFSSPMFQINTGKYKEWEVLALAEGADLTGKGESYIPGNGPYKETPLASSLLTHSQERWQREANMFSEHPELQVGGATFRWTLEGIRSSILARINVAKISTPALILEAGADPINVPSAMEEACAAMSSCKIVKFEKSFHEILNEEDSIRVPAIKAVRDFLGN